MFIKTISALYLTTGSQSRIVPLSRSHTVRGALNNFRKGHMKAVKQKYTFRQGRVGYQIGRIYCLTAGCCILLIFYFKPDFWKNFLTDNGYLDTYPAGYWIRKSADVWSIPTGQTCPVPSATRGGDTNFSLGTLVSLGGGQIKPKEKTKVCYLPYSA